MVMIVALALFGLSGTAHASPAAPSPPGRADLLAERLAKDPIQVTDHALRDLRPGTAARIRALVARLGVPVYVVVGPPRLPEGTRSRDLIPLLRDRLGKDGVYLVTDPDAGGTAQQFGGSLPVDRAWTVAALELPYEADIADHVQRWVEILTAPNVARRIDQRRPRPEDTTPSRGEVRDRKEMTAFGVGTALGCVPLLTFLIVARLRKAARR